MAAVEELLVDQLNITVEEPLVDQLNIEAHATPPQQLAPAQDQKAVFKAGLFTSLISIGGILYPPITATVNKTHSLLSKTFHFMVFMSLAIGVLQILLSTVLHWLPGLTITAKSLTKIGWALLTIALGYGSSLVLMVSSSPWFALHLIFLSIRFM